MPSLDIVTSQSYFRNHLGAQRAQLLFHGKISYRLTSEKEKWLGSIGKDQIQLQRKINFRAGCLWKNNTPLIKAVVTVEPDCLVRSEDDHKHDSDLQFNTDYQVLRSSNEGTQELDERERLRRMKISKANKGNVPWNKGRKHSAETLQRIRERTKIAMQDPKVKMKLVNLGHAQTEETRVKIGAGVREGWQRRRERLIVQETCCLEWQNIIAEASRKSFCGDDELQWDSYKILDKQLKKEWLESVEKRKTMSRPKGSKRAPKSAEQRRKISEAISAKWADPEYRGRVCSALAKYHGTAAGAERKRRRRPSSETQSLEQAATKKKAMESKCINEEAKVIKKIVPRKNKSSTPSYKDPMASSNLEMIKKIREQRAAAETKKREATERAKLLIAEAEKAANALEMAALTSPLARASLLETRKLIAEATRSIESIESGQLTSHDSVNNSFLNVDKPSNHLHAGTETPVGSMRSDGKQVNGKPVLSPDQRNGSGFDFNNFMIQNVHNGTELFSSMKGTRSSGEGIQDFDSLSFHSTNTKKHSDATELHANSSELNGSVKYGSLSPKREEEGFSQAGKTECSTTSATKTKKKWVCGRLVEVEEE